MTQSIPGLRIFEALQVNSYVDFPLKVLALRMGRPHQRKTGGFVQKIQIYIFDKLHPRLTPRYSKLEFCDLEIGFWHHLVI